MDSETPKETAKAVAATAKFGQELIAGARDLGAFIGRVFGTAPEDAFGLAIGDWLREFRRRNLNRLQRNTEAILAQRRIQIADQRPVSPRIAIPLLHAAGDESDETLQGIWARLLANAMDPTRDVLERQSFIRTAQELDPQDAQFLDAAFPDIQMKSLFDEVDFKTLVNEKRIDFFRDPNGWAVSQRRLVELKLLQPREGGVIDGVHHVISKFHLTEYGFAFLNACRR